MLNFCSLFSSSDGNCLLAQSEDTNLLIDAGVSGKKIEEALESIHIPIEKIEAILVTHEHIDHIRSLGTISKKYHIPVYANEKTWNAMPEQKKKIAEENQKLFCIENEFEIGNFKVFPFSIPHDAADPCGFNLCCNGKKLSIATDLGHIPPHIFHLLESSSFIMLESNYDKEVLRCCSYPYSLKKRIDGPNGHLSNTVAGQTVSKLIHSGLEGAMLGHLSKESNFPDLAYKTVLQELNAHHYSEKIIHLNVADRLKPSKLIHIA